jgi:hypothetical protein
MKRTRVFATLLATGVLFLASCHKNSSDDQPAAPTCKVTKGYLYDSGAISDSAQYTYTDNKVTKVELNHDYYYTLEYTGEKVSRRNFFVFGTTALAAHDVISYNADGTISKIERFDDQPSLSTYERYDFTYANGKLAKVLTWESNGAGGITQDNDIRYVFTGNNITKEIYDDLTSGSPVASDSLTISYDAQPNYFLKQNSQYLLVDPFFVDPDPSSIAFFLSQNNITKVGYTVTDPSDVTNYSYTSDANGNFTGLNVDGQPGLKYNYQCQ